ncbi:MAG: hypothetical protein CL799_13210 [Chromatiales bacterium]|nr:hypothetical protein [Chromatiales bacterium]
MLRCANKVREAEEREEDSDDVGPETASTEMAKEKLAALSISSEIAGVAESPAGCERCAMAVVMWGTSPGFALGALVLGARLRELGTAADLLLLHTDEVPQNHLELLVARGLQAVLGAYRRFSGQELFSDIPASETNAEF